MSNHHNVMRTKYEAGQTIEWNGSHYGVTGVEWCNVHLPTRHVKLHVEAIDNGLGRTITPSTSGYAVRIVDGPPPSIPARDYKYSEGEMVHWRGSIWRVTKAESYSNGSQRMFAANMDYKRTPQLGNSGIIKLDANARRLRLATADELPKKTRIVNQR